MLIQAERSLLMLVDVQSSLAKAMDGGEACIERIDFLLQAARVLGVPVLASEQYPERLGRTVDDLARKLEPDEVFPKLAFSAVRDDAFRSAVERADRPQLMITGMEAHVCVLQTALGFKGSGFEPAIVADGVASRLPSDRDRALRRAEAAGVPVVTAEMVVFEWLGQAGKPEFKALLPLIRDRGG